MFSINFHFALLDKLLYPRTAYVLNLRGEELVQPQAGVVSSGVELGNGDFDRWGHLY